jgi:hypothetical protein
MTEEEKWVFINNLDEELLRGSVIIAEWSTFLIRDADTAFTSGANLASILVALAGIESHLRYEYGGDRPRCLIDLIEGSSLDDDLRKDLHFLRKYRNKWVHVDAPAKDNHLLSNPNKHERELEDVAVVAIRSLRRIIYQWQGV